jgi:hypothetical protein
MCVKNSKEVIDDVFGEEYAHCHPDMVAIVSQLSFQILMRLSHEEEPQKNNDEVEKND